LAKHRHQGLTWHFNPPSAPHMGGLWEAGVKSFKMHLYKTVSSPKYTYGELSTLLAKIEACLNSRPLSPLSEDVSELVALTPGHFLIGGPLLSVAEPESRENVESIRNRWQRLKDLHQHFCVRWKEEYLKELHKRNKWQSPSRDLQVGDMVIINEDNIPPQQWRLGCVLTTCPGTDNKVRVVYVRTCRGVFRRPVAKLVLLPTGSTDDLVESTRSLILAKHMGGLWEAGVKSFKMHLYKTVSSLKYTYEELSTLLAKIEACLNSRPLSPLSEDVSELVALTPGHFLIGGPILPVAEPESRENVESIRNRWQRLKALHQHFCVRWKEEYLKELHKRNKWQSPSRDLQVGDMVIIKEDNIPPQEWRLGCVLTTCPGTDNKVRVIDVRTCRGVFRRPVANWSSFRQGPQMFPPRLKASSCLSSCAVIHYPVASVSSYSHSKPFLFLSSSFFCSFPPTQVTMASPPQTSRADMALQSHMGGLWEAGVKSFKMHFYKTVSSLKYTYEELSTLLAKIEACLNSRPLSPLSEDVSELVALTPGHFLIGGPILPVAEPESRENVESIRNRWQRLKALHQHFCVRWKEEYLKELHKRNKWQSPSRDLQVGDMVIIKEDNIPPQEWRLGRVLTTCPGSVNKVRVVDVRTCRGVFRRPVAKLVLLPTG
ncbi:hypothetical protein KR044_008485, partial [Drosophila immigrans]